MTTPGSGIQDALANEEGIDIAEALMELSRTQMAYEAALRASSGILNQSTLIDWI